MFDRHLANQRSRIKHDCHMLTCATFACMQEHASTCGPSKECYSALNAYCFVAPRKWHLFRIIPKLHMQLEIGWPGCLFSACALH